MRRICLSLIVIVPLILGNVVLANDKDEIALFNSDGEPVAYIADDLTIYMWSGEPTAYLSTENSGGAGFNVYGFNGHHLGWFVHGIIWDHDGDASCGLKSVVASPRYEPYKAYKQYKPYKGYKEYEPAKPAFSRTWSDTPCSLLLREGSQD